MNIDADTVPDFIRERAPQPPASDLIVIDARVPLNGLLKALSDGGFAVINDRSGRLVVTHWPQDYRVQVEERTE